MRIMGAMKPFIGLTVLYRPTADTTVPAIVQAIQDNGSCRLFAILDGSTQFVTASQNGTGSHQWSYLPGAVGRQQGATG